MAQKTQLKISFGHPRDARTFDAEIDTKTTGQAAIDGLVKAGFIEAANGSRTYALQHQRSGKSLPLSASLAGHGVADADVVAVIETAAGAAR